MTVLKEFVLRKKRMYPKACFAHCCHSVTNACSCPCLLVLGIFNGACALYVCLVCSKIETRCG